MSETLVSLWTEVRRRLEAAGVDTPVLDARLLLEAGAGVSRLEIVTDPRRPVSQAQAAAVLSLTRRRETREPISHILGERHFWTLDLIVTPDVLTPRPETEFVVEAGLQALARDAPARILDLGVGSGAIALALLIERPNASAVGVDASAAALAVARRNLERHGPGGILFEHRDVKRAGFPRGPFDLVISNPPYVSAAEFGGLQPEVRTFEPESATTDGEDGLSFFREILRAGREILKEDGAVMLEIGYAQSAAVEAIASVCGYSGCLFVNDYSGIPRVALCRGGNPAAGGER